MFLDLEKLNITGLYQVTDPISLDCVHTSRIIRHKVHEGDGHVDQSQVLVVVGADAPHTCGAAGAPGAAAAYYIVTFNI